MKKIAKNYFCKEEKEKIKTLKEEIKKLKKDNKKLSLINQSKDELISAISHEFKNPISIISGFIETIISSNLDKETSYKFLIKIQKNALRLSELIDRLYLITKLENKKIELKKTTFDIFSLTKELIASLNNERIKLIGKKHLIRADKQLIEIVISNLIQNALKYSKKEIIVKIENNTFSVIDFGTGIDKKEIELITNKFYRIAKNEWDNSLGLGLSIVVEILKMHNLHLDIKSEINKGSEFSFDFTPIKE